MMLTLVTDRTRAHVTRLKVLAAKGWDNMSASEKSEWLGEIGDTTKGAYNHTDLNRVEMAVQDLASLLGLTLTTKTDWSESDIPSRSNMERYLGNIQAIRAACQGFGGMPVAPETIDNFTYVEANNIETILKKAYEMIEAAPSAILGTMVLGKSILGREE